MVGGYVYDQLRSTKVLSSSEQLKVAAASMLKSDPAHDLGASASSVVGREGQELRKIKRRVGRVRLSQTVTFKNLRAHTPK